MTGLPTGLDFAAIMAVAAAQDVDLELLASCLPDAEIAILSGLSSDEGTGDPGDDPTED